MTKTILITGSTDGIGLAAAKSLAKSGHTVLLHGRNENKLNKAIDVVSNVNELDSIDSFIADLSDLSEVKKLADEVLMKYPTLGNAIKLNAMRLKPSVTANEGAPPRTGSGKRSLPSHWRVIWSDSSTTD